MRNSGRILGKRNVMKFCRSDAMVFTITRWEKRKRQRDATVTHLASCVAKGLWRDKKGTRVSRFFFLRDLFWWSNYPFLFSLFFLFLSFSLAQFPSPSSKSHRWLCAGGLLFLLFDRPRGNLHGIKTSLNTPVPTTAPALFYEIRP